MTNEYICALDIGTTKICALIAELDENSMLKIIGVGTAPSDGLRRGVVINLEKTIQAIIKAREEAERMAGVEIEAVYAGIAGDHIRSVNGRGVVAVAGENHIISMEDKRRVIDAAKAVSLPFDREIIHILPQEFIVDDQRSITDPVGMSGVRLEAEVHIVTCAVTAAQNIWRSIEGAHMSVMDLVLEPLASSYSVLTPDEKDLGVCVLDIGGGTTDIAMFYEGCIRHTAIVSLGGRNVTNDIAHGLRTPIESAEAIKVNFGSAVKYEKDEDKLVEVPGVGGRPPRKVAKSLLVDIIQPRMEEILTLAHNEIKKSDYVHLMTAGAVLTGGAAMLPGTVELAEEIFEMPVKLGVPSGIKSVSDDINLPLHSTGVGLIMYGKENSEMIDGPLSSSESHVFEKIVERMKRWFVGSKGI
ncbi:MAG: cell division protein FtsA [Deferribacteres bacterium]|nr:cell division protein FtsA [candidate division KSB1 bacterium]MCB9510862.1 cell division protein FtsA [Deferribacteres bacterium]